MTPTPESQQAVVTYSPFQYLAKKIAALRDAQQPIMLTPSEAQTVIEEAHRQTAATAAVRVSTPSFCRHVRTCCSMVLTPIRRMVAISASVSDGSSLNFRTPTPRAICHGGMFRASTSRLIERAHGRAS